MERVQVTNDGDPSYSANGGIETVSAYGNGYANGDGFGNDYGLPVGGGGNGDGFGYDHGETCEETVRSVRAKSG